MKIHLFSIVAVFTFCNACFTDFLLAQQIPNGISLNDSTRKNTDMIYGEYHEVQPVTVFKPELIIPDSLLNESFPIKIWVKVEVDSLGTPLSYDIIKSSNGKFNKLAGRCALEYRFNIEGSSIDPKYRFISIPIVFKK
jgi:hypothetical protein